MQVKIVNSLEKIFPDVEPTQEEYFGTVLKNETYNFQIAFKSTDNYFRRYNKLEVKGALAQYITIRTEEYVAVNYRSPATDDYYLGNSCGIYPDLLKPIGPLGIVLPVERWRSVWVSVNVPETVEAGTYKTDFVLISEKGETLCETSYTIEIIGATLPETDLLITNWVHCDSIAEYHNVKPFGKKFYEIFARYLDLYVKGGNTMLLTPLFTLPLDTAVGFERSTTQLVDVEIIDGKYVFGFERLKKYIRFAMKRGVKYIEFSHLFTQWGGKFSPKIVATVDGEQRKIFGWEVASEDERYVHFLETFLPELIKVIKDLGIKDKCYFHLTDEPHADHIENYAKCRSFVKKYIGDIPIIDAMSDYSYYEKGLVDIPVPITTSYADFEKNNVTDIIVYNCRYPSDGYYSNRFINMPSQRTRILGMQLYKSGVKGYLHWGYNFYSSAFSWERLDPYAVTDGCGLFPCGDAYIVYPTKDGVNASLRYEIVKEGYQDYRALKLLESKIGRSNVLELLDDFGVKGYDEYPRDAQKHIAFRKKINNLIRENL